MAGTKKSHHGFDVRFPDGRPSTYFYRDDLPSRRLRPDLLTGEAVWSKLKLSLKLSAIASAWALP